MADTITLRGEHLINLYRYAHERSYRLVFDETKGYTSEFARRHDDLMQKIIDHPTQPARVVMGCDDLCLKPPCPKHSEGRWSCSPRTTARQRPLACSWTSHTVPRSCSTN